MRKLHCLLLVAVALLGSVPARADVGPPVHVTLLGDLKAAEPGQPYVGQLRIDADIPAVLGKFRFGGAGWNQLSLSAGTESGIDKSRPLVFDFSVVAADPGQWLEFSFEFDGYPITRYFDLSPSGVAMATQTGATMQVEPTGDVTPLNDKSSVSPTPGLSEEKAMPAPGSGEKARNIRVRGRFVYLRSDGFTIGADAMTVRVCDDNAPFGYTEQITTVTDAQGWYDVTFTWNGGIFDAEPDLFVKFETTNGRVQVESPTTNNVYAWQTGTTWNYLGSDLDYAWQQPGDINLHPAVHNLTNLVRTWRWMTAYGYDTPFIRANWPAGAEGAWYNGEIYTSTAEQWNENVASHEYGHHWVENFASSPAPAYCNGICDDSPTECGHCLWCRETANVSFTEGFPDWMGDVIPGSFAATYGRAARAIYDMENVFQCGMSYDDPLRTEGFLAAVVRDIGDATNDDHADFTETDELALGWGAAITCVDLDHPTTAAAFLTAFKNRYPAYREGLWATAKNCGYEIDVSVPPAVTGLASTSHVTTGNSPDPTIDLAWTRAVDDCSGVRGYGVLVAGYTALPAATMNVGDVTNYTTSSLAPGTYYVSIRTLDRSGKWSGSFAWSGPYTIRAAVPANLTHRLFTGWNKILVPRSTNDATFGSVPAPATLPGNAAGSYWNVGLWNSGESTTGDGFYIRAYVDSDYHWWVYSGALGPLAWQYGVNLGPLNVRGGRHTLESRLDATELVAETNESDNAWANQWVWTPMLMTPDTQIQRAAPPLKTAGWEAVVDGSALYYNSDGLSMGGNSWWDATVLRPLAATVDHDLYLHTASTGATNGFAAATASSARGSGVIDAVIVNRNMMGWNNHDVGVVNYNNSPSNYEVVHTTSTFMAFGDSVTVPFGQRQMLRVWEFHVGALDVGPVSITVDVDPAVGPVYATWLNKDFQMGGINTSSAWAMTDANGRARMDINIPVNGYNGLVVYRDPDWSKGIGAIDVTIEIEKTPPDFVPLAASGWHAPIVPRAAFDGTGGSVPAPTTLPGNANSTYINVAARNESPSDSPGGLPGHIYMDGIYSAWVAWGAFPAYGNGLFNWDYPFTFTGGRHTLAWKLDADNAIEEIHENNNVYSEQWVWTPLDLINNNPVVRAGPPDAYGGWTELSTGEVFWPNCDGMRMWYAGGYWSAVAAMPGAGSDVDLRLHMPSSMAKDGFAENLAGSYWGQGESDYVLVNYNLTGIQPYDVGAVRYVGLENFTVEATATDGSINFPDGVYGPYSLPANRILNLVELYLPAGHVGVHLMNLSGNVDWGLTLHPTDLAFQGKSDALAISYASGGAGGNEVLDIDVQAAGWYGLAVWKRSAADLPLTGSYNLVIGPRWVSGVDDQVPPPLATALVDITPNPFNPQTQITFDLASEGGVKLEIYDLQGRLIRALVDGKRNVGRHTEIWNGCDDAGGRVASGLYLARLEAAGASQMKKMTLLK